MKKTLGWMVVALSFASGLACADTRVSVLGSGVQATLTGDDATAFSKAISGVEFITQESGGLVSFRCKEGEALCYVNAQTALDGASSSVSVALSQEDSSLFLEIFDPKDVEEGDHNWVTKTFSTQDGSMIIVCMDWAIASCSVTFHLPK